jgi:hypothetical protein
VSWMTQRSFFRTSLLSEEDLTTDDVAHGSANTGFTIDGLAAWSSGSWCWSFNRLFASCYCSPKPFG